MVVGASPFLTQDPTLLETLRTVEKIAAAEVPVLILGESGTGKELIAKQIHASSKRAKGPLISLNCGALQESLLISELFGHEKGAFTGAVQQKRGLVECAHAGTLFLDEIGEMGPETQAKLLRFLQNGEFVRLGGNTPIRVNARLVSATNRNLDKAVAAGKFREDLFYRINTFSLKLTPLRKRREDIPLLISHFLERSRSSIEAIQPKAMEVLKRYNWPGNVRELQNTVERLTVLCDSKVLTEDDIPLSIRHPLLGSTSEEELGTFSLEEVEKHHILKVLAHFKGNKTRAAQAMGITVKTLYNKLAVYETENRSATDLSPEN